MAHLESGPRCPCNPRVARTTSCSSVRLSPLSAYPTRITRKEGFSLHSAPCAFSRASGAALLFTSCSPRPTRDGVAPSHQLAAPPQQRAHARTQAPKCAGFSTLLHGLTTAGISSLAGPRRESQACCPSCFCFSLATCIPCLAPRGRRRHARRAGYPRAGGGTCRLDLRHGGFCTAPAAGDDASSSSGGRCARYAVRMAPPPASADLHEDD